MYTSPTMNMAVASTPQTYSAICLSCHDGTVALDALPYKPGPAVWAWNATGNIMTAATSRESMLGTDLRGEHPISMIYDTTKDRAFVMAVSGAVNGLPLYGTAKNLVECTTCHSVHDNTIRPFLRVANSGSALCFKCHLL
jgi:predicted CXXCH cytochrome family protein